MTNFDFLASTPISHPSPSSLSPLNASCISTAMPASSTVAGRCEDGRTGIGMEMRMLQSLDKLETLKGALMQKYFG